MAKKILVVEDDRQIAMALNVRLKGAGYEVSVANDAISGVTTAKKVQPDLILLDISMPAGNGFLVAERVQALLPVIPSIIFITASKNPELQKKAEEYSPAGYFEKPYDADVLLAKIRETLGE